MSTSTLTQVAQIITNLEHFEIACVELERSLTSLRFVFSLLRFSGHVPKRTHIFNAYGFPHLHSSVQRGGTIRLTAGPSFNTALTKSLTRITSLITSKLDDFFELSEYDWTPNNREDAPSMYLYELVNWLTTVVDSLVVKERYKDEAYKGAVGYIAQCLMVGFYPVFHPSLVLLPILKWRGAEAADYRIS